MPNFFFSISNKLYEKSLIWQQLYGSLWLGLNRPLRLTIDFRRKFVNMHHNETLLFSGRFLHIIDALWTISMLKFEAIGYLMHGENFHGLLILRHSWFTAGKTKQKQNGREMEKKDEESRISPTDFKIEGKVGLVIGNEWLIQCDRIPQVEKRVMENWFYYFLIWFSNIFKAFLTTSWQILRKSQTM